MLPMTYYTDLDVPHCLEYYVLALEKDTRIKSNLIFNPFSITEPDQIAIPLHDLKLDISTLVLQWFYKGFIVPTVCQKVSISLENDFCFKF